MPRNSKMLGITAHFRRQDGKSVDPPVSTFDRSGYTYTYHSNLTDRQVAKTNDTLDGDVRGLMYAFTWNRTPQGDNYWRSVYLGLSQLLPEDRDYIEWLLEEYS
jgi:hypothetical protein